jgi:hypothetical protein
MVEVVVKCVRSHDVVGSRKHVNPWSVILPQDVELNRISIIKKQIFQYQTAYRLGTLTNTIVVEVQILNFFLYIYIIHNYFCSKQDGH